MNNGLKRIICLHVGQINGILVLSVGDRETETPKNGIEV